MNQEHFQNLLYWTGTSFVIGLELQSGRIYVAQMGFLKDGSIFIQCPYFKAKDGIASIVRLTPDGDTASTVEFMTEGKVTSHLVKYSHHPDGRVHFSQDGRVLTEIKRDARFPLNGPIGKLLRIDANRPADGFSLLTKWRAGRGHLLFGFKKNTPDAIRLTFQWRRKDDVKSWIRPKGAPIGPKATLHAVVDGARMAAFFVGQPKNLPFRDHLIVITCEQTVPFKGIDSAALLFRGGADSDEVSAPGAKAAPTEFLAAMYPVEDRATLESIIGSIDYRPPAEPKTAVK